MMLSLPDLVRKYQMKITGIVHAGARIGEEAQSYEDVGADPVWWIEANPELMEPLRANVERFGHRVINAVLYDREGQELDFHVTGPYNGSSSVLPFGTHKDFSPDIKVVKHLRVVTSTLDGLAATYGIAGCNFLVLDLQGAELLCLRGAVNFLKHVDYVFTEVNKAEVYVGCAKVGELDVFLGGFKRVETLWVGDQNWGDALFVRQPRG